MMFLDTIQKWEYITELFIIGLSSKDDNKDLRDLLTFLPPYICSGDRFIWTINDVLRMLHRTSDNDHFHTCDVYTTVSNLLIKVVEKHRYFEEINIKPFLNPMVIEYISSSNKCSISDVKGSLPAVPAIYSVWATKIVDMCDYDLWFEYPLYVGQTMNLQSRFKSHHRMSEFEFLVNCGLDLNFYYIEETPFRPIRNILNELESKLIEYLQPKLNNQLLTQINNSKDTWKINPSQNIQVEV